MFCGLQGQLARHQAWRADGSGGQGWLAAARDGPPDLGLALRHIQVRKVTGDAVGANAIGVELAIVGQGAEVAMAPGTDVAARRGLAWIRQCLGRRAHLHRS
jgi:hypothetical protein